MLSVFWKSVFISPIALSFALLLSTGAIAAPKNNDLGRSTTGTANDLILNKASGANQVKVAATEPTTEPTSESEVASEIVQPGDWSYKALQSVANKYGCNANLNNQPVSRLEFARGLNACLNTVEIALAQKKRPTRIKPKPPSTTAPSAPAAPAVPEAPAAPAAPEAPAAPAAPAVTQADLDVIRKLTQEYRAQLTEIDGRVTSADKRISQIQSSQFSTTTKLKGEAVFNVSGALSGSNNTNFAFGDRVRLLFESSFTGKDKLFTRLATGNVAALGNTFNSPSNVGAQVVETGGTNAVSVDWLAYQFPVSNANVYVAAFNGLHADYAPTYGSNFDDFSGASGAVGAFAESSPIYKIGGGSGVGTSIPVAETGLTSVNLGYFAFNANNPAPNQGLFGIDNAIFGQLNFKFSPQFDAGLTYVNSSHSGTIFNATGVVVGTPLANSTTVGRTTANSFGAQFAYKASDKLAFNAFAMTSNAKRGNGTTDNIWSYGGGISFPDIDGKGSLLGLFVGAEPYVSGNGSVPIHVEGFYKYKLSDNLSITPGLIFVTNPDQTNGNNALVGVLRTTFLF